MLPIVDRLTPGEPLDCRRCVGAGEHDERDGAGQIELSGAGGHTQIVAPESDADVGGFQDVVEVVVVPQDPDGWADARRELGGQRGLPGQSGI
ncbi:hypothetical protein Kisp02_47990 [Kineosporia sp. NBRC 101731]|nr:hypothetical protein Kisp02_47990 [Kineosporia sp. NBRC 101731]